MDNATPTEIATEALTVPVPAQTNAEVVFGQRGLADDSFPTIKDAALRDLLACRGHSVCEQDGLWFSCCTTTCHEDQAEAEQSCVGGLARALGDEVQA